MKTLILLGLLCSVCWAQPSRRGVKIKSDKATVELGVKGDVVLRRQSGGSLAVDAKFLQVKDLKIGKVTIEQFIEQAVRKQIKPQIKECKAGYTGAFCDQKCKNADPKTSTFTDGCNVECKTNFFFNGKKCVAPTGAKCNIPNSNKLPGASCQCNQFFGGKLTVHNDKKIVTGRCDRCGIVSGFNADLTGSKVNKQGWSEITNWRTKGNNELYENADEFTEGNGRFYPKQDGYFLCSANVRFDSFTKAKSYSSVLIAIDGDKDRNNGMSTVEGNGGSTNYRSMMVSGTLQLKGGGVGKGQYASVFTFSAGDNSYVVQSESGFSCHQLDTNVGFHADKDGHQKMKKGWKEVSKWRVDGTNGLYSVGGGFAPATGRYTAPTTGVYYCYAMVRMDNATQSSYFRLNLNLRGQADVNNGFHAIRGNKDSNDKGSLNVAGTIYLKEKKDFMSVYVYSHSDNNWAVHNESGWGCHLLGTQVGFHADLQLTIKATKRSLLMLKGWRTNGNNELYAMGPGGLVNGYYTAPYDGFYVCATQVRIDSAKNLYFKLVVAVNGGYDTNNGLSVTSGNEGSQNYRTLRTAGVLYLKKAQKVSVYVYPGNNDNTFNVNSESGFSCNMLKKKPACPKCTIPNSNHKPGLACACKDGYAGKIEWKNNQAIGTCVAAPCNVANSNKIPGQGCKCNDGYFGKITFKGTQISGKCTPAPCTIPGSNKKPGPACKCQQHYGGSIVWRGAEAVGSCTVCGENSGFNADLHSSKGITASGWKEVGGWRTKANNELYETNNEFNDKTGRFAPKITGYYLCNANVRLDKFASTGKASSGLLIAINGKKDANNGLHTIEGNGGSTNFRSMTVSGTMQLSKGQYASVWVHAENTKSYTINSESGFSCHRFEKEIGFHVEKKGDQTMKKSYSWITGWRVTGTLGLYSVGGGFDAINGRFKTPVAGVFYCSSMIRFESAATNGYFRLGFGVNNGRDVNNGLVASRGNKASSDKGSLNIAGTVKLALANTVQIYTYSSSDNSWKVHDQSGWSCHLMGTMVGFHADTTYSATFKSGWSRVINWRTSGPKELYAMGLPGVPLGVDAQGFFNSPDTGYYACAAQLKFEYATGGFFRIVISVNGQLDVNSGLQAVEGNKGSTNYFTLRVAGTTYMKTGDTISVSVFSDKDDSYRISSESGFSCHKFTSHYTTCPACKIANSNKLGGPACKCNPGFAGKIAWKGNKATGTCTASKCNVAGSNKAQGEKCKCNSLYVGEVTWGEKGASGPCVKCGPSRGFNADLKSSSPYLKAGFYEIKNWRTDGNNEMFESDGSFNNGNGRFYPKMTGTYLCNANIQIDSFTNKGSSGLFIAINGNKTPESGMYTVEGDGGSSNYRSMMVTGVVSVTKGQYVSVFVQSIGDNQYRISSESGFSCNLLGSPFGFHADKDGDQSMKTGWKEVSKWRVKGTAGLYNRGGFDIKKGRYTVTKEGAYYCYAMVRMDNTAPTSYFRLNLNLKGQLDVDNGFHAIRGNKASSDKGSLNVAGTIHLKKKDFVSVYVYSHSDKDWSVNSTSGFGCHRLGTNIGFHAANSKSQTFKTGWVTPTTWRTSNNNELYALGGASFDKYGRFVVPSDGYYICAAQLRIDAASNKGYFRAILSISNQADSHNGASVISGNMGSTNYRSVRVAGVFQLKVKQTVSVKIYNNADLSWTLHKQSGFSCNKIWHRPPCPDCTIANSNKMGGTDCTCNMGYTGKITWKNNKASGVCKPQACNIANSNKKPGTECACAPGFNGKVTWQSTSADPNKPGSKATGTCKAAPCNIPNSNMKAGPACKCNAKFSGTVKWAGAAAYGACNACGHNRGFNADFTKAKAFTKSKTWYELAPWRTNAKTVIYEASTDFDNAKGRYTAKDTGYYFCNANVKLLGLQNIGNSYSKLVIAINGKTNDAKSGLHTIEGNGGSTNSRSMTASGNIQLKKGQYASVFVYSSSDSKFSVGSESGFSCHQFSTKYGFHATKGTTQTMKRGYKVVSNWIATGAGSYNAVGTALNLKTGLYRIPSKGLGAGVYYCSANIRMDQASSTGWYRLLLTINNSADSNNGLSVVRGNKGSTNYGSLTVGGTLMLSANQYTSVYAYASSDNSWKVQADSSWGCHQMGTRIGFHADFPTNQLLKKGWSTVTKWKTAGNNELYAFGGGIDAQGHYTAPETGYYACGVQLRLQNADSTSYFSVIIAVNDKNDINAGLHVIDGNRGSTNYRSMTIAGSTYLKKGDKTSVKVFSEKDTGYYVMTESGFSCHKFVTPATRC